MSETSVTPRRQPSVLLIVSLCVNIALIGLVAITYMRSGMRGAEPHERNRSIAAPSLMRMVPAEESKIRGILEAHRKQMRELRRAAMQAREQSFLLLAAKDFKADDFAKSLDAVQAADAALEAETMKITAESIAVLTPQERETVIGQTVQPDRAELRKLFRKISH